MMSRLCFPSGLSEASAKLHAKRLRKSSHDLTHINALDVIANNELCMPWWPAIKVLKKQQEVVSQLDDTSWTHNLELMYSNRAVFWRAKLLLVYGYIQEARKKGLSSIFIVAHDMTQKIISEANMVHFPVKGDRLYFPNCDSRDEFFGFFNRKFINNFTAKVTRKEEREDYNLWQYEVSWNDNTIPLIPTALEYANYSFITDFVLESLKVECGIATN